MSTVPTQQPVLNEMAREIEILAQQALDEVTPWLKEQLSKWPHQCCADTCSTVFPGIRSALRGRYDLRRLTICRGRFDSSGAAELDGSYDYHWEVPHVWIAWSDIIIDPTAGQFLAQLPTTLLVTAPGNLEHRFYHRSH